MNNKDKKIVLINRAVFLPGEGGYKRTVYLYDMMRRLGYNPTLLTSDFNHYRKQARNITLFHETYPEQAKTIEFLHTPIYSKNISLRRYISERVWTRKVKIWVSKHADEIDVVMLSMPDMNTILAIEDICRVHNIKIVVDVRDLRPEAFRVLIENDKIYNLACDGMRRKADRAYSAADELLAVSQEYLDRGLKANKKSKNPKAIYIGAVLEKFDHGVVTYSNEITKSESEFWITYAGTLGTSYDLNTIIDSAKEIKIRGYDDIRFMILGQGPEREELERYAGSIGADNVSFVGFVDYEMMAAYLNKSDLTVNAIKKRGSQSIINKVADYFAAGIPMLNGCACKEQQDMVDEYNVGVNYEAENEASLTASIISMYEKETLRIEYGANARMLAEEKFDRERSYLEIIDRLCQ